MSATTSKWILGEIGVYITMVKIMFEDYIILWNINLDSPIINLISIRSKWSRLVSQIMHSSFFIVLFGTFHIQLHSLVSKIHLIICIYGGSLCLDILSITYYMLIDKLLNNHFL